MSALLHLAPSESDSTGEKEDEHGERARESWLDQVRHYEPPPKLPPPWTEEGQQHPYWERVFVCADSGHALQIPFSMSQLLFTLAMACIVFGAVGYFFERRNRGVPPPSATQELLWYEKVFLALCLFCGVAVNMADVFSDIMTSLSFGYCGHWKWMMVSASALLVAQFYLAWQYSKEDLEATLPKRVLRFIFALTQIHMVLAAIDSWRQQRYTPTFARHKFMESVLESAPQGLISIYVLYFLNQRFNFWLICSVFSSICSLGYGASYWLEFSVESQLGFPEEQLRTEDDSGSLSTEHKALLRHADSSRAILPLAEFRVRWYHHFLWTAYFAADFGLRLLTIGLFLGLKDLRPWNTLIFVGLLLLYSSIAMVLTSDHDRKQYELAKEEGATSQLTFFAHRLADPLLLTVLVNVLPADLRLIPRDRRESHLLFALDPVLREKMVHIFTPLRLLDFAVLGAVAMLMKYDAWQCAALLALFVAVGGLLPAVMGVREVGPTERMRRGWGTLHALLQASLAFGGPHSGTQTPASGDEEAKPGAGSGPGAKGSSSSTSDPFASTNRAAPRS